LSTEACPNPSPESLLVVRLGAMGDIIHTLPAVAALRSAFPQTRLGWVIEQRWLELLCAKDAPSCGPPTRSRPLLDFVHVVDTKRWRKYPLSRDTRRQMCGARKELIGQRYELAVDFQGAIKSAILSRFAKSNLGMDRPREAPARMMYKSRVRTHRAHVVEQYHSLAEAVAGKSLPLGVPQFPQDDSANARIARQLENWGGKIIVMNPGAGWAAKQWPGDRYGEVARALSQHGYAVLVNFGPGEEELAKAVRTSSNKTAVPISCSIAELIALMRQAKLFIGGDTGPLHLAAALEIPVVAIFGPTDPMRNGPYRTRSLVLRDPASRTSLSHTSTPDHGLLRITTEEVIAAARQLLEETHA
jgi:heptosyltransferase I